MLEVSRNWVLQTDIIYTVNIYIYIYITMVRKNSISWHIAVIYYD